MSGLEDLFNSPVKAPPPPPNGYSRSPSPSSPPRQNQNGNPQNPLFFSPGGEESNFGSPSRARNRDRYQSRLRSVSPSITAPNAGQSRSALQAEQTNERVYTTYQLGDFEDPFAALNAPIGNEDEEDGEGTRKRRKMAKVDADRLTSDRGIPALCRAAKKFKVKGKGYETQDLKNLLNMYQMWAHGMFPKGDFQHTINRVEVICRSKRMESAIKGYRDAFYPPPRTPSPAPLSDRGLTPPTASQEEQLQLQGKEPLFTSRPPQIENDDDGLDADLEEMMALEEMEREASNQIPNNGTSTSNAGGVGGNPGDMDEEDEFEGLYD